MRVRWRGSRQATLLAASVCFVALAFAAPDSAAVLQRDGDRGAPFADSVAAVEEKIDLLAEEEALEEDQADELRETLEELTETAREDAMRAWEMLDHAEQQLAQSAEEAAEQAVAETGSLAEVGALAEALAADQAADVPRLDAAATAEGLDELSQMLDALDGALAESLAEALAEAGYELDADALRELADRLRESDGRRLDGEACDLLTQLAGVCDAAGAGEGDRLRRMVEARLIDPAWAEACEAAGECDGDALLTALMEGGRGIGSDPAPMTFADTPIETENAAHEAVALSPAAIDRDGSALLGLSSTAPEETLPERRSDVSALDGADSGGGAAASQTVLPRHRGAVQRYFERQ